MMMMLAALATAVALSDPGTVVEIDADALRGTLTRLSWSDDGSALYLQSVERDRSGNPRAIHHVLVSIASKSSKSAAEEPAWSTKYWTWKAGQASPVTPSLRIAVEERTETKRSVAAPAGGVMARGGTADPSAGTTLADAASAADNMQAVKVFTLKLKDETIGEWQNEAVVPGSNFSWAPAPLPYFAYAKRGGGPIIVIDSSGSKQQLEATKAALLPAWSSDGGQIAWLERKGKKYQLISARISAK